MQMFNNQSQSAASPSASGTPIPGMGGSLTAQRGLTVGQNPMAQQLQSHGRGQDSMLVHMTPNEVNSLQGLAMAHGGSLTINPQTGLPEAGFLGKILPMIAGIAGSFVGIPPWITAAAVGGATGIAKGNLGAGLMAGLSAFGASSAATSLGAGAAGGLGSTVGGNMAELGVGTGLGETGATLAEEAATQAATQGATQVATAGLPASMGSVANTLSAMPEAVGAGATTLGAPTAAFGDVVQTVGGLQPPATSMLGKFGEAARTGIKPGGMLSKYAPMAAGVGLLGGVSDAFKKKGPGMEEEKTKYPYRGPYHTAPRVARYDTSRSPTDSSEQNYFAPTQILDQAGNPVVTGQPLDEAVPYASGGQVGTKVETGPFGNRTVTPVDLGPVQAAPNPYSYNPQTNSLERAAPAATAANPVPGGRVPMETLRALGGKGGRMGGSGGSGANNPYSYNPKTNSLERKYADGGTVNLRDGAFIVDARTVSELGNGSSSAGQELLARMGGKPLHGPGDGVSDSIPAKIAGKQEARVARDEVKFDPEAVARLGGGSPKKGAQKLYALMTKAEKARKSAKRGGDNKIAKGLGALR